MNLDYLFVENVSSYNANHLALLERVKSKLADYPVIMKRDFYSDGKFENEQSVANTFRIMQWNTLARSLCSLDECSFSSQTPHDVYDWNKFRKWRILEELLRFNCDIICAEELDTYNDLKDFMHAAGYAGVFCPKHSSPCLKMKENYGPDGCAVFYKSSVFQIHNLCCQNVCINNDNSPQVFVIVKLKHLQSGNLLTVVCVHLKAKPENHAKRAEQITFILSKLKEHLNIQQSVSEEPILICGDFNGEPFEKFYQITTHDEQIKLASAYNDANGEHLSTFKIRETIGLVARAIDYIFYTKSNLKLVDHLKLPNVNEIDQTIALPNLTYPSDHMSLVCDFKFN